MYEFLKGIIDKKNYILADFEQRIIRVYVLGKITEEQMNELLALAAERADDAKQIDVAEKIAEIEARLNVLESKGLVVWVSGTVTAKGQTVLYDVDGDGVLDLCMYAGGRATTTSSPGKITGWYKVNSDGVPTHTITKVDGEIVLTPVEPETM